MGLFAARMKVYWNEIYSLREALKTLKYDVEYSDTMGYQADVSGKQVPTFTRVLDISEN